jgi:hypothetical protein
MKNNQFVLKDGKLQFLDPSTSSLCTCCDNCNSITCPGGGVSPFYEKPIPVNGVQFSFSCSDTWEAEAELSYTVSQLFSNWPVRDYYYEDCVTMTVYSKRYIKISGMSALNGTYGSFKSPYGAKYFSCDTSPPDPCSNEINSEHICCSDTEVKCLSCCHTPYIPYKLITVTEILKDNFSMVINGESFPGIIDREQNCSFGAFAAASTTSFNSDDNYKTYAYPHITYINDMPRPSIPLPTCFTEEDLPRRLIGNRYGIEPFLIGETGGLPNNGVRRMYVNYSDCKGNENACIPRGGCNFSDYSCRSDSPESILPFNSPSCEYYKSLDEDIIDPWPPFLFSNRCRDIIKRGFFRTRVSEFSAEGDQRFI